MNLSNPARTPARRLMLASACLMTVASPLSRAQLAPATSPNAATLARYDKNNNGKLDADEVAAMEADQKKSVPVETTPATAANDVVALSPFEVVSDTKGYYASNTMSGTRFNAKLDDLASSISVVTKQQMSDFAMLDINDIFAYTGNTEGTETYTDTNIDRKGSPADNVQANPQGANRIRGIAPANVSLGNIETMGRVPLDPIAVDAIEISRGPNANVFGLGNPSGTVNQVAAAANLTRNRSQVQLRGDSYGGFRTSLDVNRVLLKGELAVRGSAVFQHDAYTLKPSGTNTERFNGMIKFQPFKSTTITAATSYYKMNGNRPNSLPPRDNITYWINSGRPTWDPTTQQIHINGATIGTFSALTYNGPDYFSPSVLGGSHSQMFIDQNGVGYWSAPQAFNNTSALLAGATTRGPTAGGQADRFLLTTGFAGAAGGVPTSQPLFTTTPAVTDKAIYDWSSINISSPNRLMDRTITSTVQLDQILLNTPLQTLAFQLAAMREDSQRYTRNTVGVRNSEGQSGQVEIDINERLLDGTPNPYFLRPFMASDKPISQWTPQKWDTYRGQFAYKLDLTHESNLLKWLGLQQLTAYNEYKYRINRQWTFRQSFITDKSWLSPGSYLGYQAAPAGTPAAQGIVNPLLRFYVGDNAGNNIDYAPGDYNDNGTYNFVWGRAADGTLPAAWNSEPTTIGLVAADKSGARNNFKQIIKTSGAVLQSHLLNDAFVATLGLREDKLYSKFGLADPATNETFLTADKRNFNYDLANHWAAGDYQFDRGKTTNVQYVVRPFRDLPFLKSMDEHAGAGHAVASALRGMSLNYNRANSFVPQTPAQDLYGNILPPTTGEDKSFGLGLNLLDGKVVLRVTHYDTVMRDIRYGDANTVNGRVIRTDLLLVASTPAKFVLQNVAGGTSATFGPNNNQAGWIKTMNPTWTDAQVFTEFSKQIGLSESQILALINPNPGIAATNDVAARGTEVELNVNLTPWWTVAANVSDTQAYIRNVSGTLQKWIDERMKVWTTLVDQAAAVNWTAAQLAAEPQHLWWTHNYGGTQTAQQNFIAFVQVPYNVIKQLDGQANPQTRRYTAKVSTNLRLSGLTEHRLLRNFNVGGAVRWEDKGAIGFYGKQQLPAAITDIDVTKPIWDKGHYYYDAMVGYRTKLWSDKIGATIQLNVKNIFEGGRLQRVGAYPDGTAMNFRIIDPRQFILTATFDM